MEVDLFGNEIVKDELLRDKFIEPPFSILDTKSGNWADVLIITFYCVLKV